MAYVVTEYTPSVCLVCLRHSRSNSGPDEAVMVHVAATLSGTCVPVPAARGIDVDCQDL